MKLNNLLRNGLQCFNYFYTHDSLSQLIGNGERRVRIHYLGVKFRYRTFENKGICSENWQYIFLILESNLCPDNTGICSVKLLTILRDIIIAVVWKNEKILIISFSLNSIKITSEQIKVLDYITVSIFKDSVRFQVIKVLSETNFSGM